MATERLVTLEQFRTQIEQQQVSRQINEIVVHHTWKPSAADYRGIDTVRGVRRYHVGVRGWSDNGYHVMIGPDGSIFLCRPIARAGAHVAGRNGHTIGVSFVANFDHENPASYRGLRAGQQAIGALLARFNLGLNAIRFHREFAPKTCPGMKLGLAQFRREVGEVQSEGSRTRPKVVLLPESSVIECDAVVNDGVTRTALRPVVEALGYRIFDHRAEQGKLYLVKR